MYIRELVLRDFRSWPELSLSLKPGVTLFVGRNGFGKTNIIEAIGYAAHLSSHRVSHDAPLVRAGCDNAHISVTAINHGRELTAHLLLKAHGANRAQINRTKLQSTREILGVVQSVLFSPEDLALVRGEPAGRRHYLDAIIATRYPRLAGVKADYDKVLRQRNALLKSSSYDLRRGEATAEGAAALSTLEIWNAQLAHLGAQLIQARVALVDELACHVHDAYAAIAPESRPVSLQYRCTVELTEDVDKQEKAILEALDYQRDREIQRGVSLVGPHRDDLELLLGDQPAKGFASHGETWSYAISLRFGEFSLLRSDGTTPILILDDVFAELDARRRSKLVTLATDVEQVFITAAVDEDLPDNLGNRVVNRFCIGVEGTASDRISVIEGEADGWVPQ